FSIERVTYLNGRFFALGDNGTFLTSSDGSSWQSNNLGTTAKFYAVAARSNLFIAGGSAGIMASLDGTNWGTSASSFSCSALGYGSGMFVAVGTGTQIYTSPDATNWTTRT